jgi:adenylate cyclase class 2
MDEIEIKFRLSDPDEIRRQLKSVGAVLNGKVFERNVTFDDAAREFGNDMNMLRVRDDGHITITFKEKPRDHRFMKRREINLKTEDFQKSIDMIKSLGFLPVWSYEKHRENWILGKTLITVDRLPFIGDWMEIEGPEKEIDKTIKLLGLSHKDGVKKTYKRVFQDYCAENKMEFRDMVF